MSRTPDLRGAFFTPWRAENDRVEKAVKPGPTPVTRRRRIRATALLAVGGAVVAGMAVLSGSAAADPSAATWYRLRVCESSDDYATNTGNGHYGAYQFDLPTWRSVGGTGYPNLASKAEQDARALILYRERGWSPWQCARILGLTDDSDAGTGDLSGIVVSRRSYYAYGDDNATIARWQKQMGRRGADLVGTGLFGPKTLAAVEALQRANGLAVTGRLGALTWSLAWHGRYGSSAPAYPGTRSYRQGDLNDVIARFQRQLDTRGATFEGTGQFGPKTLAAVLAVQRENGLPLSGQLGVRTWRAAWNGVYRTG